MLVSPTEEYELYMKKLEAASMAEVTTMVQEPQVGDVPPIVVTTMEQMTTTIISGQVGPSFVTMMMMLMMMDDVWECICVKPMARFTH